MKVYAVCEIGGYYKGQKVKVYKIKEIENRLLFLIWNKNLNMWCWYQATYFAPYPFWKTEDEDDE